MPRLTRLSTLPFLLHAYYATLSLLASSTLVDHLAVRGAHKTIFIDQLTASGYRKLGALASYFAAVSPSLFDLISQVTICLIPTLWLACLVLTLSDVRVGILLFLRALTRKAPAFVIVAICTLTGALLVETYRLLSESYGLRLLAINAMTQQTQRTPLTQRTH